VGVDDPLDRREAQAEPDAAGFLAADIWLKQRRHIRVGWQSRAGVGDHGRHPLSAAGDVNRDRLYIWSR
jgi:hypothetical protein